jgi:hypothetical protein
MTMLHRTGSLRALKISVGGCDVASMALDSWLREGTALAKGGLLSQL